MSEGKPRPEVDVRRALAEWPARDGSAVERDEMAHATLARIASGDKGRTASSVSDEDLLRAPLAPSQEDAQHSASLETGRAPEGDGRHQPGARAGSQAMTTTSTRERDRSSLQELAKLASMTPAPPSAATSDRFGGPSAAPKNESGDDDHNSGVIDLAAIAASDPSATARAKATPLASQGLFEDDAAETAPREQLTDRKADDAAKAAEPEAKPLLESKRAKVAEDSKGSPTAWIAIGGVVAAAAVAAGVFFGMKQAKPAGDMAVASRPVAAPVQPQAPAAAATAQPEPQATRAVDPASLPQAPVDNAPSAAAASNGANAAKSAVAAPSATATAAAASTTAPAAPAPTADVAAKATASAASSDGKSLQDLMQQAAGTTPAAAPPAPVRETDSPPSQPAAGSVPLKPGIGAVQGAIGAVVPGARACLGPDEPVSHATIVFKSDGAVESVSVAGGAAGKPQEACIRAALSKARVAPFAQPTYAVSATIRPN